MYSGSTSLDPKLKRAVTTETRKDKSDLREEERRSARDVDNKTHMLWERDGIEEAYWEKVGKAEGVRGRRDYLVFEDLYMFE